MYRSSLDELCNLINGAQEVVQLDHLKNDISYVLCEVALEFVRVNGGVRYLMEPQDYVWNEIKNRMKDDSIFELPEGGLWKVIMPDGYQFVIKLIDSYRGVWQIGLGIKNAN